MFYSCLFIHTRRKVANFSKNCKHKYQCEKPGLKTPWCLLTLKEEKSREERKERENKRKRKDTLSCLIGKNAGLIERVNLGWIFNLVCFLHFNMRQLAVPRKIFLCVLWWWSNIGPGCLEMFWNLCPWAYSKCYQTGASCSNWTPFKQGMRLDDLWRDLPTQLFYDSVLMMSKKMNKKT